MLYKQFTSLLIYIETRGGRAGENGRQQKQQLPFKDLSLCIISYSVTHFGGNQFTMNIQFFVQLNSGVKINRVNITNKVNHFEFFKIIYCRAQIKFFFFQVTPSKNRLKRKLAEDSLVTQKSSSVENTTTGKCTQQNVIHSPIKKSRQILASSEPAAVDTRATSTSNWEIQDIRSIYLPD